MTELLVNTHFDTNQFKTEKFSNKSLIKDKPISEATKSRCWMFQHHVCITPRKILSLLMLKYCTISLAYNSNKLWMAHCYLITCDLSRSDWSWNVLKGVLLYVYSTLSSFKYKFYTCTNNNVNWVVLTNKQQALN